MPSFTRWIPIASSIVLALSSIVVIVLLLNPPEPFEVEDPRTGTARPTWQELSSSKNVLGSLAAPHTIGTVIPRSRVKTILSLVGVRSS